MLLYNYTNNIQAGAHGLPEGACNDYPNHISHFKVCLCKVVNNYICNCNYSHAKKQHKKLKTMMTSSFPSSYTWIKSNNHGCESKWELVLVQTNHPVYFIEFPFTTSKGKLYTALSSPGFDVTISLNTCTILIQYGSYLAMNLDCTW